MKYGDGSLSLSLEWRGDLLGMSLAQGALVANTFDQILSSVLTSPAHATLSSLHCLSPENLDQIREWNGGYSIQPVESCVHTVIADQVVARPDAEAVCAWDGTLTYRELDVVAGHLAGRLVQLGVGPESLVPLCFEKSVRCPHPRGHVWLPLGADFALSEVDTDSNARRAKSRRCFRASRPISPSR